MKVLASAGGDTARPAWRPACSTVLQPAIWQPTRDMMLQGDVLVVCWLHNVASKLELRSLEVRYVSDISSLSMKLSLLEGTWISDRCCHCRAGRCARISRCLA